MPNLALRPFRDRDLDGLYAISLATGHASGDASALYADGRMMGHIYSAPYAKLCPDTCFVAEDEAGVAGFIVGAVDTRAFEARLERDWWPDLRARYPDPGGTPPSTWTADQRRCFMIHHPRRTPDAITAAFPAHLHMNLLPRRQGQGVGRSLLELWFAKARERGVTGVHVGTNANNHGALRFWRKCGFECLPSPASNGGTVWLGRHLDHGSKDQPNAT